MSRNITVVEVEVALLSAAAPEVTNPGLSGSSGWAHAFIRQWWEKLCIVCKKSCGHRAAWPDV